MELQIIAHIENDFTDKFGVPRQSGFVPEQKSLIVFEEAFRDANALRGIDGYSHLWLIWGFHKNRKTAWSPLIRPPRLGGNRRMGVFATRSPYRPNPLGLSSVVLEEIRKIPGKGTVLVVSGADLVHGTPIYDIKPYLSFTDSHPEARNGFAQDYTDYRLQVDCPQELLQIIPEEKRETLLCALALDPRPAYQADPNLTYGLAFGGYDVRFRVEGECLHVVDILPENSSRVK